MPETDLWGIELQASRNYITIVSGWITQVILEKKGGDKE